MSCVHPSHYRLLMVLDEDAIKEALENRKQKIVHFPAGTRKRC